VPTSYLHMPIIEYNPDYFDALQELVAQVPRLMNLAHRPFVDYYYASRSWCKLYLSLSESGKVVATLGRELRRFEHNSREVTIRTGSNWFSLRPGAGRQLSRYSAMSNPDSYGMVLMASPIAVAALSHMNWAPVRGVTGYFLNGCSLRPWSSWWKSAANLLVRQVAGKRISKLRSRVPADVTSRISIREEFSYVADLLPQRSPFSFRFSPNIEYLDWRYNLSLSFVRYRLFRIMSESQSVGYVILNDAPDQMIVAQCDADDATVLAYGVLRAILEAGQNDRTPRSVFLSCSHSEMRPIFENFGFRKWFREDLPFGFLDLPPMIDRAPDISSWLVNYDWSDNGLQAPFLDQRGAELRPTMRQIAAIPIAKKFPPAGKPRRDC